ncbi:MAG TPA: ATP-binding protein, partial [Kofleriaceae bacterium]
VERLSLVPLTPLAQRLAQMIRSLASELDKSCDSKIDFGELVVPPATSRVVGEILLHAVRNALDHGIEAPDDRVAAGKDAKGVIEIAAYALGDRLVVTVRDDGRGVDVERVRSRALERGVLSPGEAETARPAQLLDLLFHPGFSTAKTVTMVSGRGIGMDVIRSLAEEHGGSVAIASTSGRGTELTIELPLSQTAR